MVITSKVQLEVLMIDVLAKALDNTVEILLKELKQHIKTDVYDSYSATWDNAGHGAGRTGQFEESWNATKATIKGNIVSAMIHQGNAGVMIYDTWQHGHPFVDDYGDALAPETLAEIINNGLDKSNFGFPAIQERPYWDNFITYVEKNFDTLFKQECRALGLRIV